MAFIVAMELTPEELRKARRWLMITGILSLVAGTAAILVPAIASVTVAVFTGWLLLVIGTVMLSNAWTLHTPGRGMRILHAVLTIAAGLCLIVFPLTGTLTLTFFLSVWFLGSGVIHLLGAWRMRTLPGIGWLAFDGLISLILGALILLDLPSSAGWAIGLLVGINLLFFGMRAVVAAGALRRAIDARTP
jgi:uncharacterized membrane protein HdeD (DUF308 family)